MHPFEPYFRNAHLSTLAGNFWKRALDETRFPTLARHYQTYPHTQVLVHENSPQGEPIGDVLLLHGLEGSSLGGYMVSMAQTLLEAGFRVHRVNMRGCCDTEHLTETLYHAGLTDDLHVLVREVAARKAGPIFVVGYSLGGNVTLKLAGELGDKGNEFLSGVVAVSTPIDLHACVRQMMRRENLIYELRFVTRLRERYLRRHRARPERFPIHNLRRTWTVFDFDDRFTAPHFGFGNAPNYYKTQSAIGFLPQIRVPTLMVQAKDDPLIPFALFESGAVRSNPCIEFIAVDHGGHLGFISRTAPRFWIDPIVRDWLVQTRNKRSGSLVSP